MTNEEKMNKYMQRNVKMFPTFLALTWDVVFVWTISTMFFTSQKGLSYSQVVLLDSVLMLIGCVMCVPLTRLFKDVSSVRASQIGAVGYGAYLLLCIFGTKFITFICAQFFLSFAYIACGIKGNGILTKSLNLLGKDKDYDKIYGKGMSMQSIIEAVGAILITYVYNWQPYACYWISFAVVVFVELYMLFIIPPEKFQKQNIIVQAKQEQSNVQSASKTKKDNVYARILKSSFFISLLIFMFLIRGATSIVNSNFKIYLQQMIELGVLPVTLFGYVYAGGKLMTALSSKFQFKFNLKFNVRSVVIFTVGLITSFVLAGVFAVVLPTNWVSLVLIIIVSYVQMCIQTPCRIFVNNYMQVCISPKDIETAYSIRTTVEYLGYAIISAMYSALLTSFNNNYGIVSLVYMGILSLPLIVSMILFIKSLIKKHAQKYTIIKPEYTDYD